jgi:ATP-dependent RNA helicase RhlE
MQNEPTTFADLALAEPIQRALLERDYKAPSPIQAQALPPLLEGRDLIGLAQTGTGKTAAFCLPMLHRFQAAPRSRRPLQPRGLILAPTRELAAQIGECLAAYSKYLKLSHAVIFGGVGQNPQVRALRNGVDIVVATPGRLWDLHTQGFVRFDAVEIFVLDEVDRMLDMGFIHDIKRIAAKLPSQRQTQFFSATLPAEIAEMARQFLREPVRVQVAPPASTVEKIVQKVRHVRREDKVKLLLHTLGEHPDGLTLIFARTKHGADRLTQHLCKGGVRADAIHGNKSQNARQRALDNFRSGRVRALVATDIAARGIDVKGIDLVVNYELPAEPDAYVHRIGRTARAGADGLAISFCDHEERDHLRSIQRNIRQSIPVDSTHPFAVEAPDAQPRANRQPGSRPRHHRGRRRGFRV